jgi:hypothetical protein
MRDKRAEIDRCDQFEIDVEEAGRIFVRHGYSL